MESTFKSGWRPFLGWGASIGLLWSTVGAPTVTWALALLGHPVASLPSVPADLMLELVLILLGVSGLRTFEKTKGVAGGAQRPATSVALQDILAVLSRPETPQRPAERQMNA